MAHVNNKFERKTLQLCVQRLFSAICGVKLLASRPPRDGLAAASWAFTVWICAACSFTVVARAVIPDFSLAIVFSYSLIFAVLFEKLVE